jgi:hypothetical protein
MRCRRFSRHRRSSDRTDAGRFLRPVTKCNVSAEFWGRRYHAPRLHPASRDRRFVCTRPDS